MPDNSAPTALIKLLDDKETSVRLEATKALGEIGTGAEVATSSLFSRLSPKMEKDASIRLQAVKSLWSIAKQKEKVLSAILLACNDPDRNVRDHARTTILPFLIEIDFEAKEAVPVLVEVLKSDDDSHRTQAAKLLGKVGKSAGSATPALIALLIDKSPPVRGEAANALKTIPHGCTSCQP